MRGTVETASEVSAAEDELVFLERNADGYVLRWTTRSVDFKASPDRQAIMQKIMAAIIDKPILIQTDAEGRPQRVVNMAETRALLLKLFETMTGSLDAQFASKPAPVREAVSKVMAGMVGMYRDMTDDQLGAVFLDEPQRLLGFGGAVFDPEHPVPYSATATLPLVGTSTVSGFVELLDAKPAEITISASAVLGPADVKRAITAYLDQAMAGLAPAQHQAMMAALAKLEGFRSAESLTLTVGGKDGVVRRASYRKQAGTDDQLRTETKSYALTE